VYVNNANLQLKGDILIGSEVNPGSYPGLNGHGIYVTGASPIIEGVTVQYQKRGGIHIESSTSGSPINVVNLPEYASSQYDRRLTYGSGSSIRPIMKSGNGATYLVFQRPETGEIYFKKTLDQGASWSMEKVIASNQELGNMDFAADGNNLAFVWEDHQDYMKLYVIYSNDGGESWTEEPMEIMLGYWPSIAVSGSNIYLIYRFIQFGGPDFFMGVRLRWNGNGMLDLEETFYNPGLGMQIGGIPKVTVGVGGTIHVVIADLTMPGGNIYYWRSTDNGESWAEPSVLGTWNYHGSTNWDFPGYFSMNALGTAVNLIWNSYDTGNYEIYGLYSTDSGSNWGLSIRHTYSTGDSMFPNVGVESGTYSGYSNIVYQSDRDGSDWIYLRRVHSSGAHLGGETCMTPETSGTFMPSIAVDYSGNAYLSWCDDRVGNSEVFVKQIHFAVKNVVASQNGKLNYGYGITISNSNGGLVEGNNVIGNDYGIMLSYSDGNVLHGNTVTTNDRFTGIRTIDSYYNVLSGNTITNSADGILIAYGIFDFSGHNLIVGNDIQFNLRGVAIWSPYSSNNIVSGNTISNNYDDGILICSPLNTVSDNIISNNGHMYNSYGIEVCDRDNTIRNNVISNNYIGVCLWDDYNTIYHNNFIDNTKRQASDGRMNTWDNGYPSGGNYWSDYTGIDEHSGLNQDIPGPDGIGDTPYAIPAGTNEDRYPLLNPVP
jgi:parallel beta-helix repeat protein